MAKQIPKGIAYLSMPISTEKLKPLFSIKNLTTKNSNEKQMHTEVKNIGVFFLYDFLTVLGIALQSMHASKSNTVVKVISHLTKFNRISGKISTQIPKRIITRT